MYQDVCYPVTKEFREKLYTAIEKAYTEALEKLKEEVASKVQSAETKSEEKNVTPSKDGFVDVGTVGANPFR